MVPQPMLRREDGQILPLLVVVILATLTLGLAAFQVGKAAVLRSGAQTAADAAALAAVKNIKQQLLEQYSANNGITDIQLVSESRIRAAADDYARRNDARVLRLDHPRGTADVKVEVITLDELGKDARSIDRQTTKGEAHARARLDMVSAYAGLPAGTGGSIGSSNSEGMKSISDGDWKDLRKEVGSPPKCTDDPSDNDVVKLGRFLEAHGLLIGENNAFGNTVDPVHVNGSWHYKCNHEGALDVNVAGSQAQENGVINGLIGHLHALGFRTIWQAPGHYDHLHVDAGCCDMGVGTAGPVGSGPIEDTSLEVKLIDWDAPQIAFGGFGGFGGGNYGGKPDPGVARAICSVLDRYHANEKVRVAAYETAIIESGVHNLPYGDGSSLGVFQIIDMNGPANLRMDPVWSANWFVSQAVRISGNYATSGTLAQAVQRSAYPDRYGMVEQQARSLMATYC
jgi:Putative Flp pilus-assembly TadE/G-like